MPKKPLPYRRRREGKTNYRKRLKLLLAGKPRFVIRLTNQKIIAQLIDFKPPGDVVLVATDSSVLKKYSWFYSQKNLPAAYLVGYLLGKKALSQNLKEAILDIGLRPSVKGSRIYACLKGALDAGLKIPHSPEILPPPERIAGRHIQDYASKIKGTPFYQKKFSQYLKKNLDPLHLEEAFLKTKKLIEENEGKQGKN